MDHSLIVQAGDLDRYADTRDSQNVIPELVYCLVKQSVSNKEIVVCRIPYDMVNQVGWDGHVEVGESFLEFVPKGKSCWEIGTGSNPQNKATKDYNKRKNEIPVNEIANYSFVFVTPRASGTGGWDEPKQRAWIEQRKNDGWKSIRIIDGGKLADWMREFPAIGRWMAKKIGLIKSLGGLSTPSEHWETILARKDPDDPPLPPELFIEARSSACDALQNLFEGKTQKLFLFSESPQDVDDFVAAFLATLDQQSARVYSNRCLFVSEVDAWRAIVEVRKSHVLIANSRLGLDGEENANLQTLAIQKGHAVVIPLCGSWSGASPDIIKLRSPSKFQIESILKKSGYSDARSKELAKIGGNRISALRRHLLGLGTLPPYATWETARLIAQVSLASKWNGNNQEDKAALEMLLGKTYGEWIETLRSDALRSDAPLIQNNEKWRFVARSESWNALGNRITNNDLDLFKKTIIVVLSEKDPKFDLQKQDRYAANIFGKSLKYSKLLREGLSETLALLGSYPDALSSCSGKKAENTANEVVRELLNEASWERWASLDSLLPLLAEAAPNEFLDALDSILKDLDHTPIREIFAQEGDSGFGGWNYLTGMLWALEALAWNPDFLAQVALILANIAFIDPGGHWANRPSNSLIDIFLPWHVQTCASFEKRITAIKAVLKEHPDVGWKLLLGLLPNNHSFTSGCYQPIWRNYISRDWTVENSRVDYWKQIAIYTGLAVELAKKSSERLCELIDRLPDLSKQVHESLLEYISSEEIKSLPETDRLQIWEKLVDIVRQHRKFAGAEWTLPEEAISRIENVAKKMTPSTPELKYHYLFSNRDIDLFDEKGNFDEQRERLDKLQQQGIQEIFLKGNLLSVFTFGKSVADPFTVGRALSNIVSVKIEEDILPSLLNVNDDVQKKILSGYIWGRFWKLKWPWVDQILKNDWSDNQKIAFFILLPFDEELWTRLKDHVSGENEHLYWEKAVVNPYGIGRDLSYAIEKLNKFGRPVAAISCASQMVKHERFDVELVSNALISVLDNEKLEDRIDQYQTVEVIKRLQKSKNADPEKLFKIEWNFLPWLDHFSSGSPVVLETRLASDPAFFSEVVALIFPSKKDKERIEELTAEKKRLAEYAYKLLTRWTTCPGKISDGSFDADAFTKWISEVKRITEETGHKNIALSQVGHILTYAPSDPDGLWIHHAVASVLDAKDAEEMRSGFTIERFNKRGVFNFTAGKEEYKLALSIRRQAEELEANGYIKFATAMRELATIYEQKAKIEEKKDSFED